MSPPPTTKVFTCQLTAQFQLTPDFIRKMNIDIGVIDPKKRLALDVVISSPPLGQDDLPLEGRDPVCWKFRRQTIANISHQFLKLSAYVVLDFHKFDLVWPARVFMILHLILLLPGFYEMFIVWMESFPYSILENFNFIRMKTRVLVGVAVLDVIFWQNVIPDLIGNKTASVAIGVVVALVDVAFLYYGLHKWDEEKVRLDMEILEKIYQGNMNIWNMEAIMKDIISKKQENARELAPTQQELRNY